ncbi:outer membrane beta-barrel protein [Mucilaginibacter sp. CSA2-8R]|uniref:outer membrane beta-barrel protein n=1 Tax=Mucilaginibacter sp. CSA2-8R TaxID=3141542 RepID=UPI00315D20E1
MIPLINKGALLKTVGSKAFSYAVLITAGTFLFSSSAFAQSKKKPAKAAASSTTATVRNRFELGIAGGLSLNKFITGQSHGGYNTGYSAGVSLHYPVYKGLGLQLEVNSMQQGGQLIKFKDDTRLGLPENFQTKNVRNSSYQINTLEVPLLVDYTFNIKPSWIPVIYAGASYAYTYNVTEHYQKTGNLLPGQNVIATVQGSQNATSMFNDNRLNFIAGAKARLPLTARLGLTLDFRYVAGATPVLDSYSYMDKAGFGSRVRSNSFVSRIGLVMPLGK